ADRLPLAGAVRGSAEVRGELPGPDPGRERPPGMGRRRRDPPDRGPRRHPCDDRRDRLAPVRQPGAAQLAAGRDDPQSARGAGGVGPGPERRPGGGADEHDRVRGHPRAGAAAADHVADAADRLPPRSVEPTIPRTGRRTALMKRFLGALSIAALAGALVSGTAMAARPLTQTITLPGATSAEGIALEHGLLFVAGGFTGQGYVYDMRTGADVATYQCGKPPGSIVNDVIVAG